jgi:hypothetical protein
MINLVNEQCDEERSARRRTRRGSRRTWKRISNNESDLLKSSKSLYFCYPITFDFIFFMMSLNCLSIWGLKKAEANVCPFIKHDIDVIDSKLVNR